MRKLAEILAHLRSAHRCDLRHRKALRHVHHGCHSAYLGYYVLDWHMPVSPVCAVLLAFALMSWFFHWEWE
jgi:hypothetical protein